MERTEKVRHLRIVDSSELIIPLPERGPPPAFERFIDHFNDLIAKRSGIVGALKSDQVGGFNVSKSTVIALWNMVGKLER